MLVSWGVRAVYVGPGFQLPAHRNAVAVLALALEAPMRVTINPSDLTQGFMSCRSVLIEPMQHHLIETGHRRHAFIYLDAMSDDLAVLRRKCRKPGEFFSFNLNNEDVLIDVLEKLAINADSWQSREPALADALGFMPRRNDPRIALVLKALLLHPNDERSAEEWASEIGLSSSRFQHLFKENVGVPFRRFRLWARMRIALRLALGGTSLTQAAMEAGLSSSAHLSAAFKGMFGISPSELISVKPLYLDTSS
jgi:AraC-like DNA-binding protein